MLHKEIVQGKKGWNDSVQEKQKRKEEQTRKRKHALRKQHKPNKHAN